MAIARVVGLTGMVGLGVVLGAGTWTRAQRSRARAVSDAARDAVTPVERGGPWAGSERCRSCHPVEHQSWHDSFHRTMTQRVGPQTVLAPFDGRALAHRDGEHAVERRGDEFWVRMADPHWLTDRALGRPVSDTPPDPRWHRAVMSTGAHHMQMYWVSLGEARTLVAFPFTWLTDLKRWVPNEATLLRPNEDEVVYAWNRVCIKCHAVAGVPGGGEGRDGFDTRVAELGIGCESCHGPGAAHVRAHQNPGQRYAARLSGHADDIVNPGRLAGRESAAVCAQCHSASVFDDEAGWVARGLTETAGQALHSELVVARHPINADQPWLENLLESDPDYVAGRFWADGMIRISGRDYNGMIESPCWEDERFTCTSCHQMHGADPDDQLRAVAKTDAACLDCHPAAELAEGSVEAHARHAPEVTACVDCHMPPTVYGLLKGIRSHQVSSPSAAETVDWGRPNACNVCHLDRSLAWTDDALATGWNTPRSELSADPDADVAAAVVWALRGDAGQRALTAWYLGWDHGRAAHGLDTEWGSALLAELLDDEYEAVRLIAQRSLLQRGETGAEDPLNASDSERAQIASRSPEMTAASAPGEVGIAPPGSARWKDLRRRRDQRIVDLRE